MYWLWLIFHVLLPRSVFSWSIWSSAGCFSDRSSRTEKTAATSMPLHFPMNTDLIKVPWDSIWQKQPIKAGTDIPSSWTDWKKVLTTVPASVPLWYMELLMPILRLQACEGVWDGVSAVRLFRKYSAALLSTPLKGEAWCISMPRLLTIWLTAPYWRKRLGCKRLFIQTEEQKNIFPIFCPSVWINMSNHSLSVFFVSFDMYQFPSAFLLLILRRVSGIRLYGIIKRNDGRTGSSAHI